MYSPQFLIEKGLQKCNAKNNVEMTSIKGINKRTTPSPYMFYFENVHKIQINQVEQLHNVHSQDQSNLAESFFLQISEKQWH